MSTDRNPLERAILGGLKAAINDHGPIDKTRIGSAAKRIVSALIDIGASNDEQTDLIMFARSASFGIARENTRYVAWWENEDRASDTDEFTRGYGSTPTSAVRDLRKRVEEGKP